MFILIYTHAKHQSLTIHVFSIYSIIPVIIINDILISKKLTHVTYYEKSLILLSMVIFLFANQIIHKSVYITYYVN